VEVTPSPVLTAKVTSKYRKSVRLVPRARESVVHLRPGLASADRAMPGARQLPHPQRPWPEGDPDHPLHGRLTATVTVAVSIGHHLR
jgi:hypothetical protein